MMFRAVKAEPSEQPWLERVVLTCEGPGGEMLHELVLDVGAWAELGAPEVVDVFVSVGGSLTPVRGAIL